MAQFIASIIPYLFLLACPLMMVFMMIGMKGMHGGKKDAGHDHTQMEIDTLKQQNQQLAQDLEDLKKQKPY